MDSKELLGLINYNLPDDKKVEDLTIDDVKKHFDSNFVGLNVAHENQDIRDKVLGKTKGSLETSYKRNFKTLGIEVEYDNLDDLVEKGFTALDGKIKEIKENSNKSNDKKLEELNTNYEKLQGDYNTVLGERDTLKTEVQEKDKNFESYKKDLKKNSKIDNAWDSVEFSNEANDFTIKGFRQSVMDELDIQLSDQEDSKDGLRITDKKTGQRISQGNEFVTLDKLIAKRAGDAKLLKVNNNKPDNTKTVVINNNNNQNKDVKINTVAEQIAAGTFK